MVAHLNYTDTIGNTTVSVLHDAQLLLNKHQHIRLYPVTFFEQYQYGSLAQNRVRVCPS